MTNKRVAIITAVFGSYEKTLKPCVEQTVPCDFICFTDRDEITNTGPWTIDRTRHHERSLAETDTSFPNSFTRNNHSFNVAKFYKQNFHNIPCLAAYTYIFWVDATIELTHPRLIETCIEILRQGSPIVSVAQDIRGGKLEKEVEASRGNQKYSSTSWFGQSQPVQDVVRQCRAYLDEGYTDAFFKDEKNRSAGLWTTCFIGFDMEKSCTVPFLDAWYMETLRHTTQDQVSFPFVAWKHGLKPHGLPDVSKTNRNMYMKRHGHGR